MNLRNDSEQLGNSGGTSEKPVFAWLDARDVERARRWGAAFSIWASYDDFVAERDARFLGYGFAGVTARFFAVTFRNFEQWLRLTGATAEVEALDAFAAHCAFRADHPDAPIVGRFATCEPGEDAAVAVSGAQCVRVRPEIYARWRNSLATTGNSASPDLDAYATQVIARCVSPDGRNLRPLVRSA
jgi:hypothetical protein